MSGPRSKQGPTPFDESAFDFTLLPDYNNDMINEEDFTEFAKALAGPDNASDDPTTTSARPSNLYITALNDWRPIYQKARKNQRRKKKRPPLRSKDETREGFVYSLLKFPLLIIVMGWIIVLGAAYMLTRIYIFSYEQFITMRGRRHQLRMRMRSAITYDEWTTAAKEMDTYLRNEDWKEEDANAYYNNRTVRNVRDQMQRMRQQLENPSEDSDISSKQQIAEELRTLVEGSVKDNFVGMENAHLYSETYYGTKNLLQSAIDEIVASLAALEKTKLLSDDDKLSMYQHLYTNYGRTALCLSGGATFAYYHFGIAKALLEADALPKIITGTSGGALVAALLATRTDGELKQLLVPALANRISACGEAWTTWLPRWYKTGARFDSIDWAKRCSWFTYGSLTFREAYQRTGRILNVTCIPSEPSSPTLLANYLTAPDCVIWSAVLASAAVPGILNPVVLMRKTRSGKLAPYSFGNKWKDGSLRTDIPLRALNTHFNVNFSIVSQVNPHINLFFFSSRGAVGRPVTHRRGRGWRGGFLGSATEQYLKLDLTKWLKVLRHLELLPRYAGQDWSEVWLQRFSGTITIWPRVSFPSDFINILADPPPERLARMIHVGQQSAWPKLKFIRNRNAIERRIEEGWNAINGGKGAFGANKDGTAEVATSLSEEDLRGLLKEARKRNGVVKPALSVETPDSGSEEAPFLSNGRPRTTSPSFSKRLSGWLTRSPSKSRGDEGYTRAQDEKRKSSIIKELGRQSQVFFDDSEEDMRGSGSASEEEHDDYGSEGDYERQRFGHEYEHDAYEAPGQLEGNGDDEWDGEEFGAKA